MMTIYTPTLKTAIREARDEARTRAQEAADTLEDVAAIELVSEGIVESALTALEDARDALLRIRVMDAYGKVLPR